MVFLLTPIALFFNNTYVFTWDALLELSNQVLPKRKKGHVVPEEYIAPKEGDSRCACPALNALANHGLLPRDGRNISFKEMGRQCRDVYNFSPSFSYFVPKYAADMLKKDYSKDTFDLEEISLHNGIEHDADQGKPHLPYDKEGNVLLTSEDLAQFSAKRRIDSRASNPEFSLHRIPEGWEPRIRKRYGLTIAAFNTSVLPLEFRTSGLQVTHPTKGSKRIR
ncbi:Chloroperoxidase [Amanita rubescens]|nr:Chloroperoxidase [Amanita rubescens]